MKIVHFAPFAPNASGMYEAARDMVVADYKAGHDVLLVDVGSIAENGNKSEAKAGQEDLRGDTTIVTATPNAALSADVLVFHTGVPDNWVVKTQAPIIFVMHGRPTACFYTEHTGKKVSFSLINEIGQWPRVKAMVTFWPYHLNFWKSVIPKNKLTCLNAPPIDEARFSSKGMVYDLGGKSGKYNIVLADQWRDDVNMYEILNGAILASERIKGLKFHIFTLPNPLPRCWELLTDRLKERDALGVMWHRRTNMEEVYRAVDLVLSPQRIATRSVAEPLSCGTPVIAANGCDFATYQTDTSDPEQVAKTIETAINNLKADSHAVKDKVTSVASEFSLSKYSSYMNKVYEYVV